MVRGVGGNIGPDLSMIGKKASRENLFESILLPSKAIADQYVQWKIEHADGKSVTGLLVAENDDESHPPRRQRQGHTHSPRRTSTDRSRRAWCRSCRTTSSPHLTEDELVDLVEYLLTLKTASLTPDSVAHPRAVRQRRKPTRRSTRTFGLEKRQDDRPDREATRARTAT